MKKINFVNGTTIDGASTFNQMQDNVEEVFNGEESMGSIVVEDIECKNIFDKDNANIIKAYANDWSETLFADDNTRSFYIPIISGETYTISRVAGKFFHIATTTELPASGVTRSQYQRANNLTSATITASSTAKYLVVSYYSYASGDTVTEQEVLDSIQIEKGSVATEKVNFKKFGYNSEESMGKIVVDDISCKNKFDLNQTFVNAYIDNSGNVISSSTNILSDYIDVISNKACTISFNTNIFSCSIIEFDNNKNFIKRSSLSSGSYLTITTTSTTRYIRTFINKDEATTMTIDILKGLEPQLEYSDKATPYTPHKEFSNKQIYSTNEQVIGTWIDGRNIYKKTISLTFNSSEAYVLVNHGISNFDMCIDNEIITPKTSYGLSWNSRNDTQMSYINDTQLAIDYPTGQLNGTGYITLYYLKSDTSTASEV